jgi:2-polyprenyl-3-methyl-5-hydroxy-6-metoxy-1,4-benzoquinol methylase
MIEACAVCGSENNNLLFENNIYSLIKCTDCGLIWKHVDGAGEELSKKVNSIIFSDVERRLNVKANKKMARDRIKLLTGFIKKGELLEIGCATGEFMEEAVASGIQASGVDMSVNYVEHARKKGLNVFCGKIEDIGKENKQYDVVVMFHLVEHILKPFDFLNEVNKTVKKNGLLFIITPNVNSFTNKLLGYKHSVYHHPDHYMFYSDKTIENILNKSGFKVVHKMTKEYPHHVFSSLKGFLGSMMRKQDNKASEISPENKHPQTGLKKSLAILPGLLGFLFSPILLPYSFLVAKAMKGHELIVIAKKI